MGIIKSFSKPANYLTLSLALNVVTQTRANELVFFKCHYDPGSGPPGVAASFIIYWVYDPAGKRLGGIGSTKVGSDCSDVYGNGCMDWYPAKVSDTEVWEDSPSIPQQTININRMSLKLSVHISGNSVGPSDYWWSGTCAIETPFVLPRSRFTATSAPKQF